MQIDKSEIIFIINPASGQKNPGKIIRKIKTADPGIQYAVTRSKEDLDSLFRASSSKYKVFVAVGGDGTVNEIASYLINDSEKVLAIFPNGSGNGFANELGFTKDISSLIEDILVGKTIDVDVLDVNGHPCINMLGLGFDSFVAHGFHESSRGLRNYILASIKAVFGFKPIVATVVPSSGKEINGTFFMISVANTRQYGNNAIASPESIPNDGMFEAILVKPFPFYLFPTFIWKMFTATLKNSKYIQYIKETKSISIVSDYKKYHIDGDPYTGNGSLKISINKSCLKVIRTKNNLLAHPLTQRG